MKSYWIIPAVTYALSCGGAEVKRNNEEEPKKVEYAIQPKAEYAVQPVVIPAPKCWREGMTGQETLECVMKDEDNEEEPDIE